MGDSQDNIPIIFLVPSPLVGSNPEHFPSVTSLASVDFAVFFFQYILFLSSSHLIWMFMCYSFVKLQLGFKPSAPFRWPTILGLLKGESWPSMVEIRAWKKVLRGGFSSPNYHLIISHHIPITYNFPNILIYIYISIYIHVIYIYIHTWYIYIIYTHKHTLFLYKGG